MEVIINIIWFGIAGLIAFLGVMLYRRKKRMPADEENDKKRKRGIKLAVVMAVAGCWMILIRLLPLIFGVHEVKEFGVEISPPRYDIFGLSVSSTVVLTWIAMGVVLVLALLVRIFVIPRFKDVPTGLQNVLESAVGGIDEYTGSKTEGLGENLSAYLFSIAVLMVAGAAVELFGMRAITADLMMTFSMALVTFVLINLYGIKKKGLKGRLKSLASPTPVVLVFRVISDCAIPVSMACRLFGNMLGGMIVMELLRHALGSAAIGIPSVVGLYFNLFHPLIQTFIFITLTLTFVNEATE